MERELNPYATPNSDLDDGQRGGLSYPPASRMKRFLAITIDLLILLAIELLIMVAIDYTSGTNLIEETFSDSAEPLPLFSWNLFNIGTYFGIGWEAFIFFLINGYLLATRGQSIGKLIMQIAIVKVDSQQLVPIGRLIMLRYFPVYIVQAIMYIAYFLVFFIDALFIFRDDRRTLHDLVAGTMVIDLRQVSH